MRRKFEYVSRIQAHTFSLPKRNTEFSAGYDFECPEKVEILPHEIKYVKTGVKADMFRNEVLLLANRSSNPKKKGLILINGVGVVDKDYYDNPDNEGEIAFAFMNITDEPVIIEKRDKLGQGIFLEYLMTEDDESDGKRTGGFGSTGK